LTGFATNQTYNGEDQREEINFSYHIHYVVTCEVMFALIRKACLIFAMQCFAHLLLLVMFKFDIIFKQNFYKGFLFSLSCSANPIRSPSGPRI
jgi:hypothetical protein